MNQEIADLAKRKREEFVETYRSIKNKQDEAVHELIKLFLDNCIVATSIDNSVRLISTKLVDLDDETYSSVMFLEMDQLNYLLSSTAYQYGINDCRLVPASNIMYFEGEDIDGLFTISGYLPI